MIKRKMVNYFIQIFNFIGAHTLALHHVIWLPDNNIDETSVETMSPSGKSRQQLNILSPVP